MRTTQTDPRFLNRIKDDDEEPYANLTDINESIFAKRDACVADFLGTRGSRTTG